MSSSEKTKIVEEILGKYYNSGDEMLFRCPRCNHHKPKMSVNVDKDVFKCWVCDYSGTSIYRLVRKYGNYDQRNLWQELSGVVQLSNFEEKIKSLFEGVEESDEIYRTSLPEGFVSLTNKDLSRSAQIAKRYLLRRGITEEDILYWKIGYCSKGEFEGRIVIPSFDKEGYINYFVGRTYKDHWKKYLNPNIPKNNIVFNHLYLDFDEDLIITEGIFDAIKAGRNSVPILGSSLKEGSLLFQEIVNNDTPIYVALDQDAEKKALSLIKRLLKYGIEMHKVDISPFNDVGEMTREQFLQKKEKAKLLTTENYLQYKLQNIF